MTLSQLEELRSKAQQSDNIEWLKASVNLLIDYAIDLKVKLGELPEKAENKT